jgi:hypothetical protein
LAAREWLRSKKREFKKKNGVEEKRKLVNDLM